MRKNVFSKIICCCGAFAVLTGLVWAGDKLDAAAQARFASAEVSAVPRHIQVALDAGHGGMDGGCVSVDGTPEKGINLDIALTERELLTVMGYDVSLTREEDKAIFDEGITGLAKQKQSDMKNRLAVFDSAQDFAISIHQNQFTDSRFSGAQMFYSRRNSEGERLAAALQKQFVTLLQPDNERETKPVDDELYLLDKTDTPAVMAECGFLSNPEEAALLESDEYRRQVAFTIMTGALVYTGGDRAQYTEPVVTDKETAE